MSLAEGSVDLWTWVLRDSSAALNYHQIVEQSIQGFAAEM